MAIFASWIGFNHDYFNFYELVEGFTRNGLQNDLGFTNSYTKNGQTVGAYINDSFYTQFEIQGVAYSTAFISEKDITYDGTNLSSLAGTINTIGAVAFVENGSSLPLYGITGVNLDVNDLMHAVLSPSLDDDRSILSQMLNGDDTFNLSDEADLARGFDGSDTMYGYGGNDKLYGGNGNDTLVGGAGNDAMDGGAGDDFYEYWGYEGFDVISETSGFDTIVFKDAHTDNAGWGALFQEGDDLVYIADNGISGFRVTDHFSDPDNSIELFEYESSGYSVLVRNSVQEIVDPFGNYDELLVGTVGNDTINSAPGDNIRHDEIYGYDGDDTIDNSEGGKSWIEAGDGDDFVIGGASEDRIRGQDGDDKLSGKGGNDYLFGGSGNDTLNGGDGDDKVYAGAGNDKIDLGSGNDYVKAGGGVESFIGGSGTDYISYYDSTGGVTVNLATNKMSGSWAGNDTISGFESISGSKTGADTITGTSGANTIKTYGGNDKVYGGKGNDKIDLGSGNDYVKAGGGVESFIGGSGTDYISYYDSTGGVTVNLATNQMSGSWAGNDTISGFESISGSKTGADTITGTSGANTIKTYGGNDKVYGGKGNDKIDLGSGNDYVKAGGGVESFIGGSGTDYISYYDSTGGVTVNLATNQMSGSWAGNDTISGFESISGSKSGADTITGTSGANTIKTYGGNDKVYGGKGNDKIDLGSGNDYVKAGGGVESFIGGSGTDYISYYDSTGGVTVNLATNKMSGSWAGNDTISGFESISGSKSGADTITGTSGANTIKTYGGNDKVYGGAGNDKIDLGSGNDYVKAGGGVESFIGGSGTDYISYYDSTGGVTVNLATNKMSGSWAGNDTISGFESISGSKTGADTITGTSGANTIKTYGGNDKVYGGKGNDKIDLGSGNDYVKAGGGVESFIGGSGTDYISYYDSTGGVTVNLATNKMSGSWAGNDTISGFESISGSKTGADTITGTSGANTIKTYGGNDKVYGGKGKDSIEGGSGQDYMYAGNDSDRDVFIFRDIDETVTGSQRDRIYQFDSGEDDIDLSFIDANEDSAGDQSFKFSSNGAAANSVWAQDSGSNVLVRGDVNGDKIHDFEIYVASVDDLYVYDFIL